MMSSASEEDLTCPICKDIFKDPVLLLCSHSFCKDCLMTWWTVNVTNKCPVCKKRSLQKNPPCNLALKILCEAYSQKKSAEVCEMTCSLHSERLRLYCLEDQKPVCVVCRDSTAHKDHGFSPVNEAAKDNRERLRKFLQPLEEKFKILQEFKPNCDQTVEHIKLQFQDTEKQIRDQFKKLHQFLLEEEEAQVRALKEEEQQKTQRMKDKMAAVSREIEALSETIRATEEQLRAADVSFLLKYKAAVERVQCCPLLEEPQLEPGALIDQAKHLGNLAFNIWTNMRREVEYRPFVLDPNTANPELVLSKNLTSVHHAHKDTRPDNPERFDRFLSVLGSEGFESGVHSWVVKVENNPNWLLGVVSESFQKKGSNDSESGLWRIGLCAGKYTAFCKPNNVIDLPLKNKPNKIIITLDFKKWKLSFCDADTNTYIHTFTCNFTEKVFPYFNTNHTVPLAIEAQEDPKNENRGWWWFT